MPAAATSASAASSRALERAGPAERGVAMVFQSYALYPHMTVAENLGFGFEDGRRQASPMPSAARWRGWPRCCRSRTLLERKPKALSGGQRQRVAIGRAIVRKPEGLPVRRAAVQPRRQPARADAHRAGAAAPRAGHDDGLRHPRPGRGDDPGPRASPSSMPGKLEQVRCAAGVCSSGPAQCQFVAGFLGSPSA